MSEERIAQLEAYFSRRQATLVGMPFSHEDFDLRKNERGEYVPIKPDAYRELARCGYGDYLRRGRIGAQGWRY